MATDAIGKLYKAGLAIDKVVEFLNVPFMGNKIAVVMSAEELEKYQTSQKKDNPAINLRDIVGHKQTNGQEANI